MNQSKGREGEEEKKDERKKEERREGERIRIWSRRERRGKGTNRWK